MGLYEELKFLEKTDVYPFHMPGHKRNPSCMGGDFPVDIDITEITGFDDLHHAEGILREAMDFASRLYGVQRTWFSVNGSTAALLAAVSAAVKPGEKILVARNCHKAVYNGLYLRNLRPVFVYPKKEKRLGISGGISASDVDNLLKKDAEIKAVVITSPTYDGIVSDVKAIAETVHGYGLPLIVDEAHGAHFAFSDYFPESAADLGADVVVHSVHKTLPSLTQTALLHKCTDRVSAEQLERFMAVYQSSSPSYILMASIDSCLRRISACGKEMFQSYTENLEKTRKKLSANRKFCLFVPETGEETGIFDYDRSKLLFFAGNSLMNGKQLSDYLRFMCNIEPEMEAAGYVLLLSSVGDRKEGFERLIEAAAETEQKLVLEEDYRNLMKTGSEARKETRRSPVDLYERMEQVFTISEAADREQKPCDFKSSAGKISGEYVYLYPPGIPVIVPGERITESFVNNINICLEEGLNVQGTKDSSLSTIQVIEGEW